MIDISIVRRMQAKSADELHMQLCAKIEQAIIFAARGSFTELLVQLPNAIYHAHPSSIRLEAHAYDIERLQFVLKNAGYTVCSTVYTDSFIIKW